MKWVKFEIKLIYAKKKKKNQKKKIVTNAKSGFDREEKNCFNTTLQVQIG